MMHSWRPAERLDSILDTCIDRLESELPDTILLRYPQSAPTLEPLLYLAAALQRMSATQLDPKARQRGRVRLRQAVLTQQRRRRRGSFGSRVGRAAGWAALLLVMLTTGLGGVTVASAAALPNDRLYTWKRGSEEIWLRVQPSPERRAVVALGMADRRVDEVAALYQRSGTIDATVVAQIELAYTRTLSAIAAASPAEQAALIEQVHVDAAQHTAALTSLADQADGPAQQHLEAAAALGEWAQTAQPGDRPTPPDEDQHGGASAPSNNAAPAASDAPRATPSAPTAAPTKPPRNTRGRPDDKGPPPGQAQKPSNPGNSNGHTKQSEPSPGLVPTAELPGIGVDGQPNNGDNGNSNNGNGNNGDNGNGNKPDQPPGQQKKQDDPPPGQQKQDELPPSQPPAPPAEPPGNSEGNSGGNGNGNGGGNGKGSGKP